jgi:hypothetical protein
MSDTNERSVASRGSLAMQETFRTRVQAGLFDATGSVYEANKLLEGVIVPALRELKQNPTLTDEEREAISAAACICEDAGRTDIAITINTALERLG